MAQQSLQKICTDIIFLCLHTWQFPCIQKWNMNSFTSITSYYFIFLFYFSMATLWIYTALCEGWEWRNGFARLGGQGGNGGDVLVVAKKDITLKQVKDKHPNKRFTAGVGSNSRWVLFFNKENNVWMKWQLSVIIGISYIISKIVFFFFLFNVLLCF